MKKFLIYIPSVIFNFTEVLIIFLLGKLIGVSITEMLIVFGTFVVTRRIAKNEMHYKDWKKCMIWSTLIFISLFIVTKVSIEIAIVMSIFSGYILTNKGNINYNLIGV